MLRSHCPDLRENPQVASKKQIEVEKNVIIIVDDRRCPINLDLDLLFTLSNNL